MAGISHSGFFWNFYGVPISRSRLMRFLDVFDFPLGFFLIFKFRSWSPGISGFPEFFDQAEDLKSRSRIPRIRIRHDGPWEKSQSLKPTLYTWSIIVENKKSPEVDYLRRKFCRYFLVTFGKTPVKARVRWHPKGASKPEKSGCKESQIEVKNYSLPVW